MNTLNRFVATAGILLALVSLSFIPAAAQTYTVTDLGTLGGPLSAAYQMNDLGQVVGFADTADGTYHAFIWSASMGMRDLGLLYANDVVSAAEGINNSGQVVGWSGASAFLWSEETGMRDLGNLGGLGTSANGINNLGQVVGQSALPGNLEFHTFLWSAASGMQDLGTLGGAQSFPTAINDSGEVVGDSALAELGTAHAFVWTQATGMQDIGPIGAISSANGINAFGQVVGFSTGPSGVYTAFVWDSTHGMRFLGTLLSGQTYGSGINVLGQVVGTFVDTENPAHERGISWTKGRGPENLNAFIHPKSPGLSSASAINKAGQIAGFGSNYHALLLTPIK